MPPPPPGCFLGLGRVGGGGPFEVIHFSSRQRIPMLAFEKQSNASTARERERDGMKRGENKSKIHMLKLACLNEPAKFINITFTTC